MKKKLSVFLCSLSSLLASSAQATIYLDDSPHLSNLKSRAEGIFPASVNQEVWGCGYEYEPLCLLASFDLPLQKIYGFCSHDFGTGHIAAEYRGTYNYLTQETNTGVGAVFRRVYILDYSRQTDEFTNTSTYLDSPYYLSSSGFSPLPGEFHLRILGFYGGTFGGGSHCFGFNLIVDYFDQSSFENRPRFLPILPLSRPKSGCYALAVPPAGTALDRRNTSLKPEIHNFSSSFVAGKDVLVPDDSGVMDSELIYETQDEYDKAYFAAQWVNPQCKWVPGHFRHKATFWGDISNFFSSLFF
jgi:hypothetical protein